MSAKIVMKTGAILRVFVKDPSKVASTVSEMKETVAFLKLLGIHVIHLLVWNPQDEEYRGQGDCGLTAEALELGIQDATVVEITEGDKFVQILNAGVRLQADQGVTHTMILSREATSYLTPSTFSKMLTAFDQGAKVAGVHMPRELGNSVLEGRVANTLAMWEVRSLLLFGGFDTYSRSLANGETERTAWGVEEIITLVRLVRAYGPCIAAIISDAEGAAYKLPTKEEDPDEFDRNEKKFGSKLPRQRAMADYAKGTLDELKAGVIA